MRSILCLLFIPLFLSAQWSGVTGPGLTNITAFAKQGDALIVGTNNQGIYRTTDRGESWGSLNGTMSGFTVTSLFAWDTLLLAGITVGSDRGLYQGNALGTSWKKITSPFSNNAVTAIVRVDSVIIAVSTTAYRSTDRGVSWQNASSGITAGNKINGLAVNGSTVFAATDLGTFRTTDHGANWTKVRSNVLYTELSTSIAAANGKVYLTNQNGGVNAGKDTIYRSTDNGETWTKIKNNLPSFVYGQYVMAYGDTVFYGMQGDGIFRSTDAGQTWAVDTIGLWNKRTISGFIDGSVLYSGGSSEFGGTGGMFVSTNNGNTWVRKLNPMSTGPVTSLVKTGPVLIANVSTSNATKGLYRSTDHGRIWSRANNGLTISGNASTMTGLFAMKGMVFGGAATNVSQGVYASADSGASWTAMNTGLPNFSTVYSFAADADTLYACLKEGLYRSTNMGGSWTKWGTGIASSNIYSVVIKNDTMFASSGTANIYRSLNRGRNWTTVKTNQTIYVPFRMWVHNNTIYSITATAEGSGKLMVCSDTGAVWTELNAVSLGSSVRSVHFSHINIIANVDAKGVLVSTNSGAAWTQINTGLYKGNTQSLSTTILSGDTLIAGNSEGGVFIRSLSQAGITSVDRIDAVTPAEYALEQNYPNPFNPSTTIRYHVAVSGDVQLTVYDAIGREVSTLVRGYAPAGTYAVTFAGSGLPSGMYLYRLQTASGVAVRRMLLVK